MSLPAGVGRDTALAVEVERMILGMADVGLIDLTASAKELLDAG